MGKKSKHREIALRRQRSIHRKAKKRSQRKNGYTSRSSSSLKSAKRLRRNLRRNKVKTLKAPKDYSFITNHQAVSVHFEDAVKSVKAGLPIHFDLSDVSNVTIDALLYILVIMNRLRKNHHVYSVTGNFPKATAPRAVLQHSGFLSHVKCNEYWERFDLVDNYYQIRSGTNNDSDIIKELVSFIMKKFCWNRQETSFVYEAISEMMYNTVEHAYKPNETFPSWYIMARALDTNQIEIVFMDTGNGVPNTVYKSYFETFQSLLGRLFPQAKPSESEILLSALHGKLRTRTSKGYRGRGLPSIFNFASNPHVENFRIITSHVNMCLKPMEQHYIDTSDCFKGCVYIWRLVK